MKKMNDFGKDPIGSLVLKLTIPAMLAQLVNVLYGIIDRIFIGNIPVIGDMALAGVGICAPIVTFISSFGTLVGIGGSIMMATTMGRGDDKEAKKILSNSFLLLIIFSAALTTIFLLAKERMIYLFGGSDVTFVYADTYLTIYTLGTFFALFAMGLNYFITCQGFSLNGMITVFIGAVSNIILDAVFVVVFEMGVAGAAIATVISQFFSCMYALVFLFSKRVKIKISFGNYDKKLMLNIVRMGISPFLIIATDSVIIIAMNAVLQNLGGDKGDMLISALTVIQSYFLLITGPLIGISGGAQPIISYNFGARLAKRVQGIIRFALMQAVVFTAVMFVISWLFAGEFVRFFVESEETVQTAIWGIRVFTLAIVPLAFQYVLVDALTALGKIKVSLYLSMFRKITFFLSTVFFAYFLGAKNAFFAEPVADILGSVQSTVLFLIVFRSHMRYYTGDMLED